MLKDCQTLFCWSEMVFINFYKGHGNANIRKVYFMLRLCQFASASTITSLVLSHTLMTVQLPWLL